MCVEVTVFPLIYIIHVEVKFEDLYNAKIMIFRSFNKLMVKHS